MRKYFIADALTFGKIVPAVFLIIATVFDWDPLIALGLFAFGELLDALDGMAAVHWPHPEWTERLWFRKNIKLVESGLDMVLGIAALIYVIVRVDAVFGIIVLGLALVIGTVLDLVIYGRILGSEKQFKRGSIMDQNPSMAKTLVSARFVAYLVALAGVMFRLFFAAITGWLVRIILFSVGALIVAIIMLKKYEDGRLNGVIETFKKMLR